MGSIEMLRNILDILETLKLKVRYSRARFVDET